MVNGEFHDIPVITRSLLTSAVGLFSVSVLNIVPSYYFINVWPLTIKRFQIWRLVTSFLLPPAQNPMEALMDLFALYKYSRVIEEEKFSNVRARYAWYLTFISTIILGTNYFLGGVHYFRALVIALTYTWAQENANQQVMFYVLKVKASYLPAIMLLIQLVVGGTTPFLRAGTGYLAAHLYLFLDSLYPSYGGARRPSFLVDPPAFFYKLFPTPGHPGAPGGDAAGRTRGVFSGFGTQGGIKSQNTGSAGASDASTSGSSTGFGRFSMSGPFKGKGKRLGD